jgi:hypothetical protein
MIRLFHPRKMLGYYLQICQIASVHVLFNSLFIIMPRFDVTCPKVHSLIRYKQVNGDWILSNVNRFKLCFESPAAHTVAVHKHKTSNNQH